jgi:Sulfotransferase domain
MALPTFFVIGAPKAGTTSLHAYLNAHPQIQMSAVKEPCFFGGPDNGVGYTADHVSSMSDYEALFDPAFLVRGESSTDYTTHPRRTGVPERIKEAVPDARFIYVVRDPVARTISHHRMTTALLGERRSLEVALGDLTDLMTPYISPSLYATQFELFLEHFPMERILVLDHAELQADRAGTLRKAHRFLGVSELEETAASEEELLRSGEWRAYPSGYAKFVASYVAPLFRWVPRGVRRGVRSQIERVLWRPLESEVSEETQERLRELYAPEVARLRELTGKDFETWSV